ncbi:expressed tetratricopeptide repeat protein [Nitzschia inconspicua]|uniref:Tetratricopeptide repeat protein n=1 Tax=Nitzschia inconspicua TaxID=303405 RepID=A0A9K3LZA4_9STRA|nr:tetratricopeptide repeat protein [Nitzschia inconspicua]KAG7369346.1 expressed tetratricopeptide repeat protein [Nitzschia inconspicua]
MFRAVVLNNEGVQRLEHGRFNDAVDSFTKVLQILSPIISDTRARHISPSAANGPAPCAPSASSTSLTSREQQQQHYQEPSHSEHQIQNHQQEPLQESEDTKLSSDANKASDSSSPYYSRSGAMEAASTTENDQFVFRDPIEIPFDVIPSMEEPSEKLIKKVVVVAMYNLALSVHLIALSSHNVIDLTRAERLYQLAFQMHLEESCDVTLLYSLALMNNLGLIYRAKGDTEQSKACFENMLSTMMYLLESDEARTIKQWDGLLSNVMDSIFKVQEVAAPAA